MLTQFIPNYFYLALYVLDLIALMYLIYENREPADTAFWALMIVLMPFFGVLMFFFFGRDWRKGNRRSQTEKPFYERPAKKFFTGFFENYKPFETDFLRKNEGHWPTRLAAITTKVNGSPVMPADSIQILPSGESSFAALKEDMRNAKKSIHMAFFIWEKDELTAELAEIILKKLSEGVEVRIAYDFMGSVMYGKSELKMLKKAGAKIFADVTDISRINYRNHRKVAIIDNVIGYTGGINIGQEYIDGGKHYPAWRDTFVRITGPAVAELQRLFAIRWNVIGKENIITKKYFPVQEYQPGASAVQLNYTASDMYWGAVRDAYLMAILNAKEKVYISSPYFIPDPALYAALETAALSGVDVKLLMTGWPDKKSAWWAGQTFFERLLLAGMKIYYYEKGFFHTKSLVVDDNFVSIGTTNFDVRSFTLQLENTLFIYDKSTVAEHYLIFADDLKESREFTLDDYKKLTKRQKLRNALSKLLSNLF